MLLPYQILSFWNALRECQIFSVLLRYNTKDMRLFFLPKILLLTIYLEAVSILFLFLFKQFFICDFQNFIWKFLQT